jgi:anaerobic sulfite reductase subunit A
MGRSLNIEQLDAVIATLRKTCRVFGPARSAKRNAAVIRYDEISSVSDLVLDEKSHFSPKETFYPISQTMLYFTGNECRESEADERDTVIFVRPCDIHAIKRLDTMFLKNGEREDLYYARRRNRLKLFMIECLQGWENCFCVSMDTNKAEDYAAAFRFTDDGALVDVRDSAFTSIFAAGKECTFEPDFIRENVKKVTLPVIGTEDVAGVYALDMWKEITEKCVSCGGCNTVCGTCSCFDTTDITYSETSRDGERRRVWASCMQEDFTAIAGGHKVRDKPEERLRFKALHKVYGFKKRFGGENMCVGCGRCDDRCPEEISFSDTINRLSAELVKRGGAGE